MPWHLKKVGDGWKVHNKKSGKTYSKHPMSKEKAAAQLRAMYANTNESYNIEDQVDLALGLISEKELTAKSRNKLPSTAFVYPGERRYPIHDISHARNALSRSSGKPESKTVKSAVYSKYPSLKEAIDNAEKLLLSKIRLHSSVIKNLDARHAGGEQWLPVDLERRMGAENAMDSLRTEIEEKSVTGEIPYDVAERLMRETGRPIDPSLMDATPEEAGVDQRIDAGYERLAQDIAQV